MPGPTPERLLGQMADHLNNRLFGKYAGKVSDVDDPLKMGRIKVRIPSLFEDNESLWCRPAVPFAGPSHGLYLIPEVDDGVWVEFEAGDPNRPIWAGCWWSQNELPEPNTSRARVLATSSGLKLVLDEDAKKIQLLHSGGGELTMTDSEIVIKLGQSSIKITSSEINLNNGMVKVTTAGASLVNDAFKVGA